MSRLTAWANRVNGQYLDLDYAPKHQPYQCHDVPLSYIVDVLGGKISDGHAPGVQGYTIDVWRSFPTYRPDLAKLVTKHYGTAGIRAGDIVYWPTGTVNHPSSHVAVALGPIGKDGTFRCVTQNPGRTQITRLSAYQVAGYLRPKTNPSEEPMTDAEMNKLAGIIVNKLLDAPIKQGGVKTGQTTTWRRTIAWMDHQWSKVKRPK